MMAVKPGALRLPETSPTRHDNDKKIDDILSSFSRATISRSHFPQDSSPKCKPNCVCAPATYIHTPSLANQRAQPKQSKAKRPTSQPARPPASPSPKTRASKPSTGYHPQIFHSTNPSSTTKKTTSPKTPRKNQQQEEEEDKKQDPFHSTTQEESRSK
jgi:hypothetical protein